MYVSGDGEQFREVLETVEDTLERTELCVHSAVPLTVVHFTFSSQRKKKKQNKLIWKCTSDVYAGIYLSGSGASFPQVAFTF